MNFRQIQSQLLNLVKRDYSGPPLRVLSSQPRSGTHWLKQMICYVMQEDPLERRLEEPSALISALEQEAQKRLIYDHFRHDLHGSILNPERYPGLRLVLLYRHPLDALISQYHTVARDDPQQLDGLGPVEYVKKRFPEETNWNRYRTYLHNQMIAWLQAGYCLPVRYEDLAADTEPELARVLDYLKIKYTSQTLTQAVEQNCFEVLSGGRRPGETDPNSHYRQGIPGEWRTVFDQAELEIIYRQVGDLFELLGYPLE